MKSRDYAKQAEYAITDRQPHLIVALWGPQWKWLLR